MAAPAQPPNVTVFLWSLAKPGALTGTSQKFTIMVQWEAVPTATSYEVTLDADPGGVNETVVGFASHDVKWFYNADIVLGDSATFEVYGENVDGAGPATTIDLDPTTIDGTDEISANVNVQIWHPLIAGPILPPSWEWTLTSGVSGLTISQPFEGEPGGIISGAPTQEGEFDLSVGLISSNNADFVTYQQSFPVKIRVSGERYIEDFHTDKTRTAINVRHPAPAVSSWNFNEQNELPVMLGDSFTLHAILRDGTGYLETGVTKLSFVAKLPGRLDGPAVLSAYSATPTADEYGTVFAWPLSLTVDGEVARAIFAAANTPADSATDSLGILLTASISYVYGGRTYRTNAFPVRLSQPISQL